MICALTTRIEMDQQIVSTEIVKDLHLVIEVIMILEINAIIVTILTNLVVKIGNAIVIEALTATEILVAMKIADLKIAMKIRKIDSIVAEAAIVVEVKIEDRTIRKTADRIIVPVVSLIEVVIEILKILI